mmetsp:Transcript_80384/g.260449  ORF Transcript_80384/g.260449 Transcript_80384/m.260449 type:complete len:259 (-) Transcript_80384:843-1619(-)
MGTPLTSPCPALAGSRGCASLTAAWYMRSACVTCARLRRSRSLTAWDSSGSGTPATLAASPMRGVVAMPPAAASAGVTSSSPKSTRSANASSDTAVSPSSSSSSPTRPEASRKSSPRGPGTTRQCPPSWLQRSSSISRSACDLSRRALGSNALTPSSASCTASGVPCWVTAPAARHRRSELYACAMWLSRGISATATKRHPRQTPLASTKKQSNDGEPRRQHESHASTSLSVATTSPMGTMMTAARSSVTLRWYAGRE